MTYAKFQYCRELRGEVLNLESKLQKHHSSKNYEKIELAKQTLAEVKAEYTRVSKEIENWLVSSSLASKYKKACTEYYIKGKAKIENLERAIKNCLGEY